MGFRVAFASWGGRVIEMYRVQGEGFGLGAEGLRGVEVQGLDFRVQLSFGITA